MSKMIPENLRAVMIQNAAEAQAGVAKDHAPVVKLYSRYGRAVLLLSELEDENNIAYGLCDYGQGKAELSYISISHLESIKHAKLRIPMMESDPLFVGKYPMSVYTAAAKTLGKITEDEDVLIETARIRTAGKN